MPVEPAWWSVLPRAFKLFDASTHRPNFTPGMWDDLCARASKEIAIEHTALQSAVPFSAGDMRIAIGDPEADVTPVLQRLVADGKLLVSGSKRWTRYRVV